MEFKLPELGENIDKGDVIKVLVAVGDAVKKDQALIEVETDKAAVEVPSNIDGVVEELLVKVGDKVSPGQAILKLGAKSAAPAEKKDEKPAKAEAKKDTAQAAAGARKAAPQDLPFDKPPAAPEHAPAAPSRRPAGPAAPSVRRLAREIGVDISAVRGSGDDGRISLDDVKAHAKALLSGGAGQGGGAGPAITPLPDFAKFGAVERVKMGGIRRATAEHMARAWNQIPAVTQHDKADITEVDALRKEYGKKFEQAGGKLTVTALALKILAAALKKFPQCNASIDAQAREIVLKKYIHIGVAVDTPGGLLVPVIRDVEQKNLLQLAVELQEIAEKARARKLAPADMQGGCMTITNLGGIGGTSFSPIVNWPESCILGLSRAETMPVWENGGFSPRRMMPLSLTYDHRIIDGADAARFLRWTASAFQQPFKLSLEGF